MSDIIGIVDDSGNLITSYAYDAWGKVISVTGSNVELGNLNLFRYRSYYYDSDIEMYYLQSRYYDPEVCRFINSDDVNFIGAMGTVGSYNAFAYCENNPVNGWDPNGRLVLNANWFAFALDVLFTATASWFKWGYDIVGSALEYYARKKGFKLFYQKLMYGVVPKVKGLFSSGFTLIRKVIWRTAGNVSGNLIGSFLTSGITKISNFFIGLSKNNKFKTQMRNAIYLAGRMTSLGSLITLVLDWASDGTPYNERIRLW